MALLPANVAAFTEGLGIDSARSGSTSPSARPPGPGCSPRCRGSARSSEAAVRDYARNITIDTDAIEEQVRDMDLQNPAQIQESLRDKLFSPTPTAEQRAALGRLETSLALVEGWVDLVTEQATTGHLPHADALGEALRRRRVSGPAQKTFSGLVGLELRPRRLKDAKNLWAALENAGGAEFRDAPWEHPDIAPTGADLDDPLGLRGEAPRGRRQRRRGLRPRRAAAGRRLGLRTRPATGDRRRHRSRARCIADANRVLHAYQPADRQQEALRLEYLAFLADHSDGVWKAGPPEHLTASLPGARRRPRPRPARRTIGARGCGSSSAATSRRWTGPCGRPRNARRPRSPASWGSE